MKWYEDLDWCKVTVWLGVVTLWLLVMATVWQDKFDQALVYVLMLMAWKMKSLDD